MLNVIASQCSGLFTAIRQTMLSRNVGRFVPPHKHHNIATGAPTVISVAKVQRDRFTKVHNLMPDVVESICVRPVVHEDLQESPPKAKMWILSGP